MSQIANSLHTRRFALLTRGLQRIDTLPALLNDFEIQMSRGIISKDLDGVLAWGHKPSAKVAEDFATQHGLPVLRIEDGFLRSVGLGRNEPPYSIVLDDLGIYYDAHNPSRLEAFILESHNKAQYIRAKSLRKLWCEGRLSKYNYAREIPLPTDGTFVLAVDQTYGDASIAFGQASPEHFKYMLEAALDEYPNLPIVLKVHPDVIAGHKRGHFDKLTVGQASRIRLLATNASPSNLIKAAKEVYTVTSQLGFEALIWERPVRCFGMPFYAGWGLTRDEQPPPARRSPVGIDDLVYAALIDYPRYLDPETKKDVRQKS